MLDQAKTELENTKCELEEKKEEYERVSEALEEKKVVKHAALGYNNNA